MAAPVSAVGALATTTGLGNSALPVTTHAVGNALVLSVKISSSTISTIGVVGGGCVGWQRIAGPTPDTEGTIHTHEIWIGTAIQTGAFTSTTTNQVQLTFSALVTGINVDISGQEFTAFSPYTTWARQGSQDALVDNSSSTTVTFPPLTAVGAGEVYVGHARCPSGGTFSNPASGFVIQVDADANPFVYNTNLTAGLNTPTITSSTATASDAMGVIIFATVVPQLGQYLPYGEGTFGAPRTYGLPVFTQYSVEPMTSASYDYTTVYVNWIQPQGAIQRYRLLSNRYGFPVDQNDGSILMDGTSYFGSQYADQNIIPGTYHYYGFYIQDTAGAWHRAGFTSCLAVNGFNSGAFLFDRLPAYFQNTADGEFSLDPTGDPFLIQFFNVIGWGLDYLKTQYNVLANHLNDPLFVPLDDLYNLAGELGMPFQAEIPASTMRKAVSNWTHVSQERGTPTGIVNNITLLTDYGVDLRIGQNIMLEQDQSNFQDPAFSVWNPDISYQLGEYVLWNGNSTGLFVYKCILLNSQGVTPPSSGTGSNSVWQIIKDLDDPNKTLLNPHTVGAVNTWEAIYPNVTNGVVPAGAIINGIGVESPFSATNFQTNDIRVYNKGGAGQPVYARTLSRVPADLTTITTTFAPDAQQAVLDGIPVPFTNAADGWQSNVRYPTNSIVTWNGLPFLANRASTGATPPSPGVPLVANYALSSGSIAPWVGARNAVVTLSGARTYQGTNSALLTPDGITANPAITAPAFHVEPLSLLGGSAWVFIPAGWNNCELALSWIDQFGIVISTVAGATVNVAANTWTELLISATAPVNAVSAQFFVQMNGTPSAATVLYGDLMNIACWGSPEWALLSKDARLRLMLSTYSSQSLSQITNFTSPISVQAEWYDNHGQYINRVGRTPSSSPGGSNYIPAGITYDSFTLGAGAFLTGRNTDTDDQAWVSDTLTGPFLIGEYAGGTAYPSVLGARSIAYVTGAANGWVAVNFQTLASGSQTPGLVFRYQDDSNYWFANMTSLWLYSGAVYSNQGNYSVPFQPGDRIYVNLNGNTIAVYLNGMATANKVLQITNSTLASATKFGIGVDTP